MVFNSDEKYTKINLNMENGLTKVGSSPNWFLLIIKIRYLLLLLFAIAMSISLQNDVIHAFLP